MSASDKHKFSRRDKETQGVGYRAKRNFVISLRNLRTLREPKLFHAETAKFAEFFEIATASQIGHLCVSASLCEMKSAPFGAGATA